MEPGQGDSVAIENLMVTLHRLPEIKAVVDTGTDLVTLFGFVLTAIAVIVGALYNTHTFKRSVESQERVAKGSAEVLRAQGRSEAIAMNRQQWINGLRDELSHFLSLGYDVHTLAQFIVDTTWMDSSIPEDRAKNLELYRLRYSDFSDKVARSRFHFAKIELFLNPAEAESKELVDIMSEYISEAVAYGDILDSGNRAVMAAQVILKNEWEKVKKME
ncbi:hypothetical protein J2Y39_004444 [Pseudomonas sp. 2957]|uniref:hypothetical protein n=1 Tax=Pseudomonas sp. 2957 TaxID=2817766 RepID=UPI0028636869|nr:hypothetical protein [Pseudomonas sp. 2957]MDR6949819.1 hypothetical protein [Pseudomonas sp. 2957]